MSESDEIDAQRADPITSPDTAGGQFPFTPVLPLSPFVHEICVSHFTVPIPIFSPLTNRNDRIALFFSQDFRKVWDFM